MTGDKSEVVGYAGLLLVSENQYAFVTVMLVADRSAGTVMLVADRSAGTVMLVADRSAGQLLFVNGSWGSVDGYGRRPIN